MQTIKIYLQESGATAQVVKDFPLFKGQYQNVLLNIFVPTSIAPILYENGEPISGTSVKTISQTTARNGNLITSQAYYLTYVKKITQNNIEYALYQRLLPSAFVSIAGQVIIYANVVNILGDVVTMITTSQSCTLDVNMSAVAEDTPIEPSAVDDIYGSINAIISDINDLETEKQDKEDQSLQTTGKTVVGAINGLNTRVGTAESNINNNTDDIIDLQNAVHNLENTVVASQTFIGNFTGDTLPTNEQLAGYVYESKEREPQNGDTLNFTLIIEGETDETYVYSYSGEWSYRIIPPIEAAQNDSMGIIKGTANGTDNVRVDIQNGVVKDIKVKNNYEQYASIADYLNAIDSVQDNIIQGEQVVAEATKATQDGDGNNIVNTYLTKSLGATKSYVKEYALPRTFNDIYYLGESNITTDEPSLSPITLGSAEITELQINYVPLYSGNLVIYEKTFELSKGNRFSLEFYATASTSVTETPRGYFRVEISINQVGKDRVVLATALSPAVFTSITPTQKISISTNFQNLDNTVLTVDDGDVIGVSIEWFNSGLTPYDLSITTNSVFPSIFALETQSLSLYVDMKEKVRLVSAIEPISTTYPDIAGQSIDAFTEIGDAMIVVSDVGDDVDKTYGVILIAPKSTNGWLVSRKLSGTYVVSPNFTDFANYLTTNNLTLDTATWTDFLDWAIQGVELTRIPKKATTTPLMDGTATIGNSNEYAAADHIHPHDTSKQDALTFDSTPMANSTNPVISGGIKTALDMKINTSTMTQAFFNDLYL